MNEYILNLIITFGLTVVLSFIVLPKLKNDFPTGAFEVKENEVTSMTINMEVQNWFNNPVYDHDYWTGSIMQNQDAQIAVKTNGDDVFSLSFN